MTTPSWPSELPPPTRDGWARQPQDARRRRSIENGPPGYRRRFSSAAITVSLTFILSRFQREVFWDFFDGSLDGGTTPFTMADPTTDGWALLDEGGEPVLDDGGDPILMEAEWLCLIGEEMPTESIQGLEFVISIDVAVLP